MNDLLPFVWLALLVIAVIIVVLLGMWGQMWYDTIEKTIPKSSPDIKNATNAIGEIKNKVDSWQSFMDWLAKFVKSLKLP